jgi:hypothetical protein
MTYAQYGTIQATDFNTLVGGNPVTTSGTLNAVWATGGTNAGYGQTAVANVTVGTSVAAASQWASLVSNTANAASHQGTSITSVAVPVSGGTVTYLSAIPTNLTTIYTSRLNAATQGSTTSNAAAYGSTWTTQITFTHTVTFASGDAARYFFNAGGQLKITCSHANNTAGINLLLNNLASNVGTVALSSPITGAVTIAGTSYNGVTRVGGGGNSPTISTNSGYYALSTSNTTLFTQTASTGPAGYLATYISIIAKTNGTQGTNGDVGNVITFYTLWDEVPDGLTAGTGSTTTVTIVPPENTYLPSASWGTPTVTGTVA